MKESADDMAKKTMQERAIMAWSRWIDRVMTMKSGPLYTAEQLSLSERSFVAGVKAGRRIERESTKDREASHG